MNDAHVMLGNSVSLSCRVPAHVADFVQILSWLVEEHGLAPQQLSPSSTYGS